ncbi:MULTISPECIES: hypothetical protein [unclassified Mycobacterium]|uniref:hypothetical protein n=1 Tax=unclassified Mycobacterium TaxID=2642494 RepID=UPI000491556C|nr:MULTISPECIES: hypothetical protein [unclassified Mycobacterium]SEB16904.1 hypothetical protein SAMN04488580_10930 [Mycobacterium sp. 283mftsu]
MNTVLYFSINGAVYETRAYTPADITDLIQGQRLQCLTSTDRQFDFWFSPTSRGCQRRVNRRATELLLATTSFTAKTVPLLRGTIVLASHDADGDLDGLSWLQLDQLSKLDRTLTARDERILNRRIMREERRLRSETAAKSRRAASVPTAPSAAKAQTGLRWTGFAAPAQ